MQSGVDEKLSGLKLEEETTDMLEGCTSVFTVVSDPLIALECTEHTAYNLIFIAEDSQVGLTAWGFMKSLRMVGSTVPVVLLKDSNGGSEELAAQVPNEDDYESNNSDGLPHIDFGAPTKDNERFSAYLSKPFTKRDLCDVITTMLFPNFHRIGEDFSSINSDENYHIDEDEMSA